MTEAQKALIKMSHKASLLAEAISMCLLDDDAESKYSGLLYWIRRLLDDYQTLTDKTGGEY